MCKRVCAGDLDWPASDASVARGRGDVQRCDSLVFRNREVVILSAASACFAFPPLLLRRADAESKDLYTAEIVRRKPVLKAASNGCPFPPLTLPRATFILNFCPRTIPPVCICQCFPSGAWPTKTASAGPRCVCLT